MHSDSPIQNCATSSMQTCSDIRGLLVNSTPSVTVTVLLSSTLGQLASGHMHEVVCHKKQRCMPLTCACDGIPTLLSEAVRAVRKRVIRSLLKAQPRPTELTYRPPISGAVCDSNSCTTREQCCCVLKAFQMAPTKKCSS